MSTIERAYALARSGQFSTVAQLQSRLRQDGFRAVEALLAPRSIRSHLEAICAASANGERRQPAPSAPAVTATAAAPDAEPENPADPTPATSSGSKG
jgi:hypothetical protein